MIQRHWKFVVRHITSSSSVLIISLMILLLLSIFKSDSIAQYIEDVVTFHLYVHNGVIEVFLCTQSGNSTFHNLTIWCTWWKIHSFPCTIKEHSHAGRSDTLLPVWRWCICCSLWAKWFRDYHSSTYPYHQATTTRVLTGGWLSYLTPLIICSSSPETTSLDQGSIRYQDLDAFTTNIEQSFWTKVYTSVSSLLIANIQ